MRKIIIEDTKLEEILLNKGKIHKEIGLVNEQIVAADKERTKLAYKNDRLKEKTMVMLNQKMTDFNLSEFEIVANVYINDGGKPEVEIIDQLEEYANLIREKKANPTLK